MTTCDPGAEAGPAPAASRGGKRTTGRDPGDSQPASGADGDGKRPTPAPAPEPALETSGRSEAEEASGASPDASPAPEARPAIGSRSLAATATATATATAAARRVLARAARAARATRRLIPRRLALPRWWPAALCVLVGVLAGLAYGLLRPAQYTATSYVAVVPGDEGDPMTALGFAQAYGRIATDTAVLASAQEESGVPVATLRGSVDAVTSPDAPMIEITGHAPSAGEAADVANAVARSLTEVADDSADATGVELTAFSRAREPREPSTPSPVLTTAVGGSAGVLVGALVLLVRPRRDERPARSAVPAPAGEQPAERSSRPHGPAREKEAVR